MSITAFHGKPELKQFYVDRIDEHRQLDHLRQGFGWKPVESKALA